MARPQRVHREPEQRAEYRADEQRRREHAADRTRARRRGGREHLEHEHRDERLPGPRRMQDVVHDAVAVAPYIRNPHRDHADHEPAEREPHRQRHGQPLELILRRVEQMQELRREHAAQRAEHDEQQHLGARDGRKHRHLVRRPIAGELAHHDVRDDRCDDHRPEAFHRDRAEHDFGDEERAGDRRVVRGRDAGGRAARDEQPQARRIEMREAADERRGERRELHHRAFAADRAAAADRQQRRQAAPQALPHGHDAVAERDGFHIVGLAGLAFAARREQQHAAREQAAGGRQPEAHVPRQAARHLHEAAAAPGDQMLHQVDPFAKRDGRERAADADDRRPDQHRVGIRQAEQRLCAGAQLQQEREHG